MHKLVLIIILALNTVYNTQAKENNTLEYERADSLVKRELEQCGIEFSDSNSVTLLTSGKEKFNDMFCAIRQARSSVHLEYFNFRNEFHDLLIFMCLYFFMCGYVHGSAGAKRPQHVIRCPGMVR